MSVTAIKHGCACTCSIIYLPLYMYYMYKNIGYMWCSWEISFQVCRMNQDCHDALQTMQKQYYRIHRTQLLLFVQANTHSNFFFSSAYGWKETFLKPQNRAFTKLSGKPITICYLFAMPSTMSPSAQQIWMLVHSMFHIWTTDIFNPVS